MLRNLIFKKKKVRNVIFFFGWDSLKGFSASHPTPPAARLGGTRSWEGAQLGQLIPADHTMWCHPQHVKLREEGRRDEYLKWWHLSAQVTGNHLDFHEMAKHLSAHGKQWINSLFCFALSVSLFLCKCARFLAFTLLCFYSPGSLPHPVRAEWVSEWSWAAYWS